ncbi:hypothetical protein [Pseudomonas sp. Leaf127]|uniref:hypothetical protein n=1 Tax=Pseudomonas sp. Leaf127 TaxID=1736267 RepID=UPI0012E93C6D|nr:hypothetical protein [Pseudomonas sp. Leaf127]
MNLSIGVSSVLGLCWVDLDDMTHKRASVFAGWSGGVSSVLGLRARTRLSDILLADMKAGKNSMRLLINPTNPTHSTQIY